MKDKYKEIYDNIKPDDNLINDILNYNKTNINNKSIFVLVTCVVFLFGSILYFQVCHKDNKTFINTTPIIQNSFINVHAATMDGEVIRNVLDIDKPLETQIICEDIRGMSIEEKEEVLNRIDKEFNNRINDYSYQFARKSGQNMGNAIVGIYYLNSFSFNLENVENIEKITVSNVSQFGEMEIIAIDNKYEYDEEKQQYIYQEINENTSTDISLNTFINGQNISLSGDRYRKCKQLNAEPLILWKINHSLYNTLNKNPEFDLSVIEDKITFTIYNKDGKVEEQILNIKFNKNGYMNIL